MEPSWTPASSNSKSVEWTEPATGFAMLGPAEAGGKRGNGESQFRSAGVMRLRRLHNRKVRSRRPFNWAVCESMSNRHPL